MGTSAWHIGIAVCGVVFGACSLTIDFDDYQRQRDPAAVGGGGAGGDMDDASCVSAQDCEAPTEPCISALCLGEVCGTIPTPMGTPAGTQTAFDCVEFVCDGDGNGVDQNVDSDRRDDNDCATFECVEGRPRTTHQHQGKECEMSGGTVGVCDGLGACVQCNAASDCEGIIEETFCTTPSCNAGVCEPDYKPLGTPHPAQTTGDCVERVCDGAGTLIDTPSDDPVEDNNACTLNTCNNGTPVLALASNGDPCGTSDATTCLDGQCAGCGSADQCGTNNECGTHTCNAGTCGIDAEPLGTHLGSQTAGNCQVAVCDGLGGITSQIDDTDLPNDNNDCTKNQCNAGAPLHPPEPLDTACGGAMFCNGNSVCVQCNNPGQCGAPPLCHSATCTANTCGTQPLPDNTPTGTQTAGDCQTQVCVMGATSSITASGDLPVDGDPCTLDKCTGNVPSNPPSPAGTACTGPSGQVVCDGMSRCVDCINRNHNYCEAEEYCDGTNTCRRDKVNGTSCTALEECVSNICAHGTCCGTSCGVCRTCGTGTCGLVKNYTDPHNSCAGSAVCFEGACCGGALMSTMDASPSAEQFPPCPIEP